MKLFINSLIPSFPYFRSWQQQPRSPKYGIAVESPQDGRNPYTQTILSRIEFGILVLKQAKSIREIRLTKRQPFSRFRIITRSLISFLFCWVRYLAIAALTFRFFFSRKEKLMGSSRTANSSVQESSENLAGDWLVNGFISVWICSWDAARIRLKCLRCKSFKRV